MSLQTYCSLIAACQPRALCPTPLVCGIGDDIFLALFVTQGAHNMDGFAGEGFESGVVHGG